MLVNLLAAPGGQQDTQNGTVDVSSDCTLCHVIMGGKREGRTEREGRDREGETEREGDTGREREREREGGEGERV